MRIEKMVMMPILPILSSWKAQLWAGSIVDLVGWSIVCTFSGDENLIQGQQRTW